MKKTLHRILIIAIPFILTGLHTLFFTDSGNEFLFRSRIIKVVCADNFWPYSYNKYRTHEGFEVDMWNKIGELSGYKIKMVTTSYNRIFDILDSGQADVAGNFLSMSTDRLEKYDISIPYGASLIRAVVDRGNTKINTLEDLKGKRIGVSLGTLSHSDIRELDIQYGYEIERCTTESCRAAKRVNQGKNDAWIEAETTIRITWLQALESEIVGLDDFKILDGVLATTNVGYLVKKNDAASAKRLAAINSALEKMLSDGTVSQLSQKWFDTDVTANIK